MLDTATGNLSGYAWAGNHDDVSNTTGGAGWISFDRNDTAGCPLAPCQANVNLSPGPSYGKVTGWAKAVGLENYDGWIHLSEDGSGYFSPDPSGAHGVTYTSGRFVGYAWAGGDGWTLGWIKFHDHPNAVVANGISGTCTASAGPYDTAHPIVWTAASISGGTAPYTYSWSGDEIPSNTSGNPISIVYSAGSGKTAPNVFVTDKNEVTGVVNCTAGGDNTFTVNDAGIAGTCTPNDIAPVVHITPITFTANITGGKGNLSYAWTSPLTQSSDPKKSNPITYATVGPKSDTVRATDSVGNHNDFICYVEVKQAYDGTCTVSPKVPYTGVPMKWTANVVKNGGPDATSYQWSDDAGSTQYIHGSTVVSDSVTYATSQKGIKHAVLTITSGTGATANVSTVKCDAVTVQENPNAKEF